MREREREEGGGNGQREGREGGWKCNQMSDENENEKKRGGIK